MASSQLAGLFWRVLSIAAFAAPINLLIGQI